MSLADATNSQESEDRAPPSRRFRWWLSLIVGVGGVAISLAVWYTLRVRERQLIESRFQTLAAERLRVFEREFVRNLDALETLTGLLSTMHRIERDTFYNTAHALLLRHPSLVSLQWVPRITDAQRMDLESELQQYVAGAAITEFNPQGELQPAPQRAHYYPVRFVEPMQDEFGRQLLGHDHSADPARWKAMEAARDAGEPRATGPLDMVAPPSQENDDQQNAILVYAPIYTRDFPHQTVEQRRLAVRGFVVGVFHVGTSLHAALKELAPAAIQMGILDLSAPRSHQVVHEYRWPQLEPRMVSAARSGADGLWYEARMNVGGRDWLIVAQPSAEFFSGQQSSVPLAALLAGLVLTGLLVAVTATLTTTNQRIKSVVAQRTAELVEANSELQREIDVREWAEKELARQKSEFAEANRDLEVEIQERERAELALRDSEALFHSLVEHLPLCVFRKDLEGRFTFHNEEFRAALGLPDQKIIGCTDFDLCPREMAEKYRADDLRVTKTGQIYHEVEEFYDARREKQFVEVIKTPVYDHRGKVIGMQGIFWDVTDRHLAEQRLKQARGELERSNQELQQFAHVASHDLREPLRAVEGYCCLIEKRFGEQLDPQARQYLDDAVAGVARMKDLLDGLLEYARVNFDAPRFESVDCNSVLEEALANLRRTIDESQATVEHDSLPTVSGDRRQLVRLFQNLIGNAIKYRGEKPPKVRIEANQCEQGWRIAVHDNGIGIDPKDSDRVFQIFQRANGCDRISGTGIGLSVCKRIVQRHGGRIWLESKPGQGSTFFFTLPRGEDEGT